MKELLKYAFWVVMLSLIFFSLFVVNPDYQEKAREIEIQKKDVILITETRNIELTSIRPLDGSKRRMYAVGPDNPPTNIIVCYDAADYVNCNSYSLEKAAE